LLVLLLFFLNRLPLVVGQDLTFLVGDGPAKAAGPAARS
jgi:hypothetical protein